ncbi:hypothetical protein CHLRE_06g286400v5 [Chlamydomonas reinhardtii]|uniref:COX assembly mitochondrial protein n=1 Tax=Chlamydomonas reinhardtii TaxID=3055 RepID=A8J2A8_CHLRE|nr:uncharacterized protein CHLRE_06g286400v5 [Chlamydomonas reinhardtii]PNW82619.1 hypothetical protein CHLRE_06g286400v5 [Chlamydomonas reinhardtii]|eukprot:XP_001695361.1 predicted protein [Chlamydomonas reinhardtii]
MGNRPAKHAASAVSPPSEEQRESEPAPKPPPDPLDEQYRRDRERLDRHFDPYLQEGFNIYRVNPRRQEAYDRCAPEVVKFLKCVDTEGPAWFWRCNALHIELQQCYNAAKPDTTSLLTHAVRDFKETASERWEQAKSLYNDILGGGEKRD